jgi:hypothetical protein
MPDNSGKILKTRPNASANVALIFKPAYFAIRMLMIFVLHPQSGMLVRSAKIRGDFFSQRLLYFDSTSVKGLNH